MGLEEGKGVVECELTAVGLRKGVGKEMQKTWRGKLAKCRWGVRE